MASESKKQNEIPKVKLWSRVRIQNVRANISTGVIIVPAPLAKSSDTIAADDPLAIALVGHREGEWIQVEIAGVSETIRILDVTPGPDTPGWWT